MTVCGKAEEERQKSKKVKTTESRFVPVHTTPSIRFKILSPKKFPWPPLAPGLEHETYNVHG